MKSAHSVPLTELDDACRRMGLDGLPSPFFINDKFLDLKDNTPPKFVTITQPVQDFLNGYRTATIWMEIWVFRALSGRADIKILGYKSHSIDRIAAQRPGEEIVDLWPITDDTFGQSLAGLLPTTLPGVHPRVHVPDYAHYFNVSTDTTPDEDAFTVTVRDGFTPATPVDDPVKVAAEHADLGIIQIHTSPQSGWGVDWSNNLTAWLHVEDDGTYIYQAGFEHASPATRSELARRFDAAIADALSRISD